MISGQDVRETRKTLGVSQMRFGILLADAMGRMFAYSQAAISQMESGAMKKLPPGLDSGLKRLRERFAVNTGGGSLRENRKMEDGLLGEAMRQIEFNDSAVMFVGTSDLLAVIDLGGEIRFRFTAGRRRHRCIAFTKYPDLLVGAIGEVLLGTQETIEEFRGENYRGRACLFIDQDGYRYCLVMEFFPPDRKGYLKTGCYRLRRR